MSEEKQQEKGWMCPKCQTGVRPDIKVCPKCNTQLEESNNPNDELLLG
jgi:hypothetical protein